MSAGTHAQARNLVDGHLGFGPGTPVDVMSPATGRPIGSVALADRRTVDSVVAAAQEAFPAWAATPASRRARLLLRLAGVLADRRSEVAADITEDNGKTLADAQSEIDRSIEHLEAAASAPALLLGDAMRDVIPGLDLTLLREPIGVSAVIPPFNFPLMTGLIYWSWALACGNTVVIKPSEQAPLAASRIGELVLEAGFPPGVVNLVHGGREAVEALCDSPGVASVSLVGSSATAQAVYSRASNAGKRVHTAGGGRNPLVVMADADIDGTAEAVVTSAFTMAGQRCLSGSLLVTVGGRHDELVKAIVDRAAEMVVGPGHDPRTQIPPLISRTAVTGLCSAIEAAVAQGARPILDGRDRIDPDGGYFHGPTVLDNVDPAGPLVTHEHFGPLLAVIEVADLDGAIDFVSRAPFGNAASIFTRSGSAARAFTRASVGNVGINVGVAAPTAQFGFGGRRRSFFGTVHSQGRHAIEFYTDIKSVSSRWQ